MKFQPPLSQNTEPTLYQFLIASVLIGQLPLYSYSKFCTSVFQRLTAAGLHPPPFFLRVLWKVVCFDMYIIRQKRGSKVSISEMSNSSKRLWQEKKTLETVRCPEVKKKKKQPKRGQLPSWNDRILSRETKRETLPHWPVLSKKWHEKDCFYRLWWECLK